MATMTMATGLPGPQQPVNRSLNTLPDPRSPIGTPDIPRSNSSSPQHPELSNEVATLSNKLIHAINHQTTLDDTLNETKHQLEAAQERVRHLEHSAQEHHSLVNNGILIRRADVEADTFRLKTALAEERKTKFQLEKEKKAMEQELESLTTALFEEANQMVANARKDAKKEREAIDKRNEQLQNQLNDAELLLASHQEQLSELKNAMQQRSDLEAQTNVSTAPSTPGVDQIATENVTKTFEGMTVSPTAPAPPTSFTGLFHPVLRTDVQAYEDFHALLELARRSHPSSRVNSGTYGGLTGLGLGNLTHRESSNVLGRLNSTASTSSLSASSPHPPSPGTPTLPHSTHSSISSREVSMTATPLKETPFYKRVLTEDIEPTLRLDLAPGLSWLARRGVISAMSDGKLIVEPMPNTTRLYQPPCSLCGEQGRGEKRARRHKFRTSESENAQRYPLCEFCLGRVRASCDFLGFLRMIKDGHWRTDGADAEMLAWEESVRLRERMFWSRIGGGVVPTFVKPDADSPRRSSEEDKGQQSASAPQRGLPNGTSRHEQNSSEVQESPVDTFRPGVDISSPIDPKRVDREDRFEHPQPPPPADAPSTPQDQAHETPKASKEESPLSRTVTRSRETSRGETGRPSAVAQTIAQRAAMFDRQSSTNAKADDADASRQLQSSLRASIKGRSSSKSRSKSPAASTISTETEPEPPLPERKVNGAETIPGSFDF